MSAANRDHPAACKCGQCRYSEFLEEDKLNEPAWQALNEEVERLGLKGLFKPKHPLPEVQWLEQAERWSSPNEILMSLPWKNVVLPNKAVSVLQDWVMKLPLREQGTLLTAVRGCDLVPKEPLDSVERQLVAFIRYCFMVPADPREVDHSPGCFFRSVPPDPWKTKASVFGHYPQHWVAHIMHALEVIGYRRPQDQSTVFAANWYINIARSMHLNCETLEQFERRLSEDRIASGEVVS